MDNQEARTNIFMEVYMKIHWFIWFPRFLLLLFSILLFMFNLDVFYGSKTYIYMIEFFLLHSIPAIVLLLILWLTWKKPMWCGILLLFVSFIFTVLYHTYEHFISFMLISGAPLLIGLMFLVVHYMHPKLPDKIDPASNLKINS